MLSKDGMIYDNPYLDTFLFTPMAQSILSTEVQHESFEKKQKLHQEKEKEFSSSPLSEMKHSFDTFIDHTWDKYLEPISASQPLQEPSQLQKRQLQFIKNQDVRLQTLQEYIRPALIPNNHFSDIHRWRFNNRFVKWLRSEYLMCKYDAQIRSILSSNPKLKHSALLSLQGKRNLIRDIVKYGLSAPISIGNNNDQNVRISPRLPSQSLLNQAFQMTNWNKTKSLLSEYDQMAHITTQLLNGSMMTIPGTTIQIPDINDEQSVEELTLEEILEVAGCHVTTCNAFNALCENVGIYEFWTLEYVTAFKNYLMKRCRELKEVDTSRNGRKKKDVVILDVGAGNGILAHFIREYMGGKSDNNGHHQHPHGKKKMNSKNNKNISLPKVIATDDGSWNIQPKVKVEKLSVVEAMKKYNTNENNHHLIIICSWMPMGEDWTQAFRDAGADEYILIGECDDGNCGHNWHTWGNPDFSVEEEESKNVPSYVSDGFKRKDLDDLSILQFSRFDSAVSSGSKTISFRKSQ